MIVAFGGSFDPVHLGHLHVAKTLLERYPIERLYFVPTSQNPHKTLPPVASNADRIKMLELALETLGDHRLEIAKFETESEGRKFTIDTLKALEALHPNQTITLVVGTDSFRDMPKWKQAKEIFKRANIIVVDRFPISCEELKKTVRDLGFSVIESKDQPKQLQLSNSSSWLERQSIEALEFNSTSIRENIAKSWKLNQLTHAQKGLPKCVWKFIKDSHLYSVKARGSSD